MSTERCNGSPRIDYNMILKDVTWLNEDYPEANMALLEGIRTGIIGYQTDKIMEPVHVNREKAQSLHKGDEQMMGKTAENFEFETMEKILRETIIASPLPNATANSVSPPKRHSALTVRPTIGEERKAWLLEAQRAYCFNELQTNRTRLLNSASEMFYKTASLPNSTIDRKVVVSCPDLETRAEQTQQCEIIRGTSRNPAEIQDQNCSSGSIAEKDSCEFLFQHVDTCFKPSKIRLSPRIEKLDKLIPKTSKEFLNTMRIVSTISPQRSEEQLSLYQSVYDKNEISAGINVKMDRSAASGNFESSQEMEADKPCSEASTTGSGLNNVACRSYKEVCIYGTHTCTTPPPVSSDHTPEKVLNDSSRSQYLTSTSGFPSLPKLVKSSTGSRGEDVQKSSPPLYSSILQRSPTNSSACGDVYCGETHQYTPMQQSTRLKLKTSPVVTPSSPTPLGTFDCGFCRTNNAPESVYRSHPLRINDVVVCPALRKYICCFCGATGDKAHTIKYCPKNPIGFFSKKSRNSPVPLMGVEKICNKGLMADGDHDHQLPLSPEKYRERDCFSNKELPGRAEQESQSDSECIATLDGSFETEKRASGNWIEAKTKGRKKKSGN